MSLNTIEEEKNETQTSNYFEGSERDESRLMSSNQLRNSQNTKDFELEEESKRSASKIGTEFFNKSLTKEDIQKIPFSTRFVENSNETDLVKKKFSQSVTDTSMRPLRNSQY